MFTMLIDGIFGAIQRPSPGNKLRQTCIMSSHRIQLRLPDINLFFQDCWMYFFGKSFFFFFFIQIQASVGELMIKASVELNE